MTSPKLLMLFLRRSVENALLITFLELISRHACITLESRVPPDNVFATLAILNQHSRDTTAPKAAQSWKGSRSLRSGDLTTLVDSVLSHTSVDNKYITLLKHLEASGLPHSLFCYRGSYCLSDQLARQGAGG